MTERSDLLRTFEAAAAHGSPYVVVHLRDGCKVDVSGLAPEDALTALAKLGATPDDVIYTSWRLCPRPRVQ
jgi:hypothetical protein